VGVVRSLNVQVGVPYHTICLCVRDWGNCYIFSKHYSTLHFSHAKIIFLQAAGRGVEGAETFRRKCLLYSIWPKPRYPSLSLSHNPSLSFECGLCKQQEQQRETKAEGAAPNVK